MDARHRHRLRLGLVALLLVGVAAFFLVRRPVPSPDAPSDTAPKAEKPAPPSLLASDPRHAAPPSKTSASPEPQPDAAPPAADAGPLVLGDGPVSLVLRFVGEGIRPTRIAVYVQPDGDRDKAVQLRLDGAKPEGRLPKADKYFFFAMLVTPEGRDDSQAWRDVPAPTDGPLVLDVTLPVRPVVEVFDVRSTPIPRPRAQELGVFDVRRTQKASPDVGGDESSTSHVRGDDSGRIRLPLTSKARTWWIGAEGYAWARVDVSASVAPTKVALSPGGGLRVEVEGLSEADEPRVVATRAPAVPSEWALPLPAGVIRLRGYGEDDQDVDMGRDKGRGPFVLDDLPPGAWNVLLGRRGPISLGEVWAETSVEVVAGQTATARLRSTHKAGARLDVTIELAVPEGWRDRSMKASIDGVGRETEGVERAFTVRAGEPLHRSVLEGLPAGLYELSVEPMSWCTLLRLKESGTVRVDLPPPARVAVRLLDEQGKPTIRGGAVTVHYPTPLHPLDDVDERTPWPSDGEEPPQRWSGGVAELPFVAERGVHADAVASGRVEIEAKAPGRLPSTAALTLAPGAAEREVELRLAVGATIEVRIVREGKVVADVDGMADLQPHVDPNAPDEQAEGWSQSRSLSQGRTQFDGLRSGSYDVSWSPANGGTRSKKTVVVRVGETATVDLEEKEGASQPGEPTHR